jgi:hypothetical protein
MLTIDGFERWSHQNSLIEKNLTFFVFDFSKHQNDLMMHYRIDDTYFLQNCTRNLS